MSNIKISKHNLQPKVDKEKIFDVKENMVQEASAIYGRPAFFIQQSHAVVDDVLMEIVSKKFETKNMLQLFYMNDEDSAAMDGSMVYGGFNMMPLYNKIIHVPVGWFKLKNIVPRSGDLIYLPTNNQEEMLFEIVKDPVKEQTRDNNVNNGRRFAYQLFMKLYTNNRGNVDIDGDFGIITSDADEDLVELEAALTSLETPEYTQPQKLIKRDKEISKKKVVKETTSQFDNLD